MVSEFPNSPRLVKGAFVEYRSEFLGPIPNVIVFQYNPEELSRQLSLPSLEEKGTGENKETFKIAYPPEETINNLKIEIDATDQLEEGNPIAIAKGIYPTLSALELLLYPQSTQVLSSSFQKKITGEEKIAPLEIPLVLFIWGISRVLPVKITSLTITEKSFDARLNPIRAEITVSMKVLTWKDLTNEKLALGAYMWTQTQKEAMARLNLVTSTGITASQFF
jgi:hypothetical protein